MPPAPATATASPLEAELAALRELVITLHGEVEALRRVDPDALAAITPAKVRQVQAVESLSRRRAVAMREAGFPSSGAGLRAWMARLAPAHAAAHGDELIALTREAHDTNRLAMRLAAGQARHVERAGAALRRAAGRDLTYGADGRTRTDVPSRTFAAI